MNKPYHTTTSSCFQQQTEVYTYYQKSLIMKYNFFSVLFCLLLAFHLGASAQPTFIVEHYTVEEGLPSNTVYNAVKDNDGFIWFGTWHGLCSFDGSKFMPFISRVNRNSDLPPRKVRTIVDDKKGYLWVRNTDNHLYLFDKRTETYHDIYNALKAKARNVQVIKIQYTAPGHVLVLTRNKDIFDASIGNDGTVAIQKIHDSRNDINPSNLKLRHNVVGENERYVYWISKGLHVNLVEKQKHTNILPKGVNSYGYTCFNRSGNYICLGTQTGDIFLVSLKTSAVIHHAYPQTREEITSINVIDGKLLFSTPSGLYSVQESSMPHLQSAQASAVSTTFVDSNNDLWLVTHRGVMVRHNPSTDQSQVFTLPTDSLFAEVKFCDAKQKGLFILLRNGEVWRYDYQTHAIQNFSSLKDFSIYAFKPNFFDIDIDSNGILWLSSTTNGVFKVCIPEFHFRFLYPDIIFPSKLNSDTNGVRGLYQTHNGDLWVSTRDGDVYCIDVVNNTVKRHFKSGEIGTVYHIMEDHQGNLWFSTKGAGLVEGIFDAAAPQGLQLRRYVNKPGDHFSLSSNKVYYTYEDSKHRIWVCTFYGGLNLIERGKNGTIVFRNKRNSLKHYPKYELYTDVRVITEDPRGRFWVGTTDGLMSFSGNFKQADNIQFEIYRDKHSTGVTDNDISTVYKDHKGNIWMGIFGSGLNRLEGYDEHSHRPIIKAYNLNDKQGGDVITSITEDATHCLWICTENGIASLAEGSTYVKNYDRFAGLPSISIEDNTSLLLKDGRMLIGCREGLLSFKPSEVRKDKDSHLITYIIDMKVTNKALSEFTPPIYEGSLKYAKEIVLNHNQSTFTIEFTAPYFTDNHQVPYTYILDGYEEQWHENGDNRIASYANVPPGHYKFRVKVNDNSSPERVLSIIIQPPWWATWWAYTIYFILFALCMYGVARLVLYMIRMRNEVYINDRLAELKIRFFTNVSHELRTPLSLIKGPIEELKNTEKLSANGKEYINLIDRNARKMLQLVNQILDFRKIQNGKMKLHISPVNLNNMIEILMQDFRLLAHERDITFEFQHAEEHVMVWCDAEKIGVVLNNLLNNAFKFTADGGRITVVLSQDHEAKCCLIKVKDDGVGIPHSQLETIFERFSQADNRISTESVYAGTGIGLSLSREYITMHGGKIWAQNIANGSGVEFNVELPIDKAHFNHAEVEIYFDDNMEERPFVNTVATVDISPELPAGNQQEQLPSILLIEDNHDLCRMLQMQLKRTYRIITAYNGKDGLDKVYHYHPDIIVTDLMMPGMDGMQLLRSVRQDFNISHIPVIMLTAKNTEEDKLQAVRNGANAFITKPFSSSLLQARISQLLEEQRIFQRKMVVQASVEQASETKQDDYERHLVQKDIEFLNKIHEIIEQNLNANDFNIDTIAGSIGLSRSAFFKKLKSLTGFAPVDLVKEIRLTKAAKKIETADDSITEIAYQVGFRDAGYFGKCFRKKYGMTPKEYRNSKRE